MCDVDYFSGLQTHPNVDKKLWSTDSVIGLKDSRPFPLNQPVGVLKWRLQTKDESLIPLQSEPSLK